MVGTKKDRKELIQKAINKYKNIFPVRKNKSLKQGFTTFEEDNDVIKLLFWFNTSDNSTHMISKIL